MKDANKKKALNGLVVIPFAVYVWIFVCFNFKAWKDIVSAEIQFGLQFGSALITLSIVLYYILLYVFLLRAGRRKEYFYFVLIMIIMSISVFFIYCGF